MVPVAGGGGGRSKDVRYGGGGGISNFLIHSEHFGCTQFEDQGPLYGKSKEPAALGAVLQWSEHGPWCVEEEEVRRSLPPPLWQYVVAY